MSEFKNQEPFSTADKRIKLIGGKNSADEVVPYGIDSSGNLPISPGGFSPPPSADYMKATYPDSTSEVYTFRSGGAGGTIIQVITVVYTDSTKNNVDTVTRT